MGFSRGSNGAQKTMGILALALVAATKAGALGDAPPMTAALGYVMMRLGIDRGWPLE
jgi:phosphate/sulfate permease